MLASVLLAPQVQAADPISMEQIRHVIRATDAASQERDTDSIGSYLSDSFVRIIETPHEKWMAKVKIDKSDYLGLIEEGWTSTEEYAYHRDDTVILHMPDGLSGLSYSTVTENVIRDGEHMTSRFREYAVYTIENGRPVITRISGHTLVGDTTPASGQ